MNYYIANGTFYCVPPPASGDELYHYGVKGMKWGRRKARPTVGTTRVARRSSSAYGNMNNSRAAYKQAQQAYRQAKKAERNSAEAKAHRAAKAKRAAKIGAAVAATALTAYGAYKLNKYVKTKNCQIAAERGYNEAERIFKGLVDNAHSDFKAGKIKSYAIDAGSGARAAANARNAANDNFKTAARNVINYKRSGGNLNTLGTVDFYSKLRGSSIRVGK